MNVGEFFRSLVHRKFALAVIAVLAVAAGILGWNSTVVQYESTTTIVAIPPGAGSVVATDNPFIHLDNGMQQLAAIVVNLSTSDEAKQVVAAAGASGAYLPVHVTGENSAEQLSAQVTFDITGPDPESSRRGASALTTYLYNRLNKIQLDAGVPQNATAGIRVTIDPQPGTLVPTNGMRTAVASAAGTVVAGIIVLLLGTAAIDFLRRLRSRDPLTVTSERRSRSTDDYPLPYSDSEARTSEIPIAPARSAPMAAAQDGPADPSGSGSFGGWFGGTDRGTASAANRSVGVSVGTAGVPASTSGRHVRQRPNRSARTRLDSPDTDLR